MIELLNNVNTNYLNFLFALLGTDGQVIKLHLGFEDGYVYSFKEIGLIMGFSHQWAHQKFIRGMARIKKLIGDNAT